MVTRPPADVPGIAAYLGTSERHIRAMVFERRIPHFRVGKLLRFDLDSVDEWVESNTVRPPA